MFVSEMRGVRSEDRRCSVRGRGFAAGDDMAHGRFRDVGRMQLDS